MTENIVSIGFVLLNRFLEVLCLMCDEMRAAFIENGRPFPPWREKKVVLSKWKLMFSIDDRLLLPSNSTSSILDMD